MTFEESIKHPIGDVARGYKNLKDFIRKADAAHQETMKQHKEQLEVWKQAMGKLLQNAGVNSAKTEAGTVYTTTIENVKIDNWEDFFAWVNEIQEPEMLAEACTPTAVLAWRDKYNKLPPGVSTSAIVNINFKANT